MILKYFLIVLLFLVWRSTIFLINLERFAFNILDKRLDFSKKWSFFLGSTSVKQVLIFQGYRLLINLIRVFDFKIKIFASYSCKHFRVKIISGDNEWPRCVGWWIYLQLMISLSKVIEIHSKHSMRKWKNENI